VTLNLLIAYAATAIEDLELKRNVPRYSNRETRPAICSNKNDNVTRPLLPSSVPCYYKTVVWIFYNTGWSKSLCAPDDYNVIVRCTETFWSPWWLQCNRHVHRDVTRPSLPSSVPCYYKTVVWIFYNTGWSKSLCAPDDCNVIVRCTETFPSPCITLILVVIQMYSFSYLRARHL
jgi:hypothetical protein